MELRHLRYAIAAAEYGSFRRAARALGVPQSSVSRRIRDLEDEIGVSLFVRHHAGVKLTNAGERLLPRVSSALGEIAYATRDAGSAGRGADGEIHLGISSSLASGFLSELIVGFYDKHPSVKLHCVEGAAIDHIAAVRQHQLDIAFVTGERKILDCETVVLWKERVFLVLPDTHPLADRNVVTWSDLRDEQFVVSESEPGPEIHDYLIKHLAELSHHPRVERRSVGRDNLLQLVSFGRGLSLTSQATTAATFPNIVYRPIAGEVLPFSAVWSPTNDNPAFRRFLSLARTMAKRTVHQ